MKRFLLISIIALFSGTTFGQITLTASTHGPVLGDSIFLKLADTTGIQAGPAGAAQTWDFSSLVLDSSTTVLLYDDLANQTFAADFPNGDIALADLIGDFSILESNTNSLISHGINNATFGSAAFTDPQILMNFPVSFGTPNVNNDAFEAAITVLGFPVTLTGTSTTEADGYGTLILPGGTFNNVLRVKITSSTTASTLLGALTSDREDYYWYDANNKNYLFTFSVKIENAPILGTTVNKAAGVLANPSLVGLKNLTKGIGTLSIFPNPVVDNLCLNLDIPQSGKYTLSVFSADGRLLLNEADVSMLSGNSKRNFDVSTLDGGIYFLNITGQGVAQTLRFVKQ